MRVTYTMKNDYKNINLTLIQFIELELPYHIDGFYLNIIIGKNVIKFENEWITLSEDVYNRLQLCDTATCRYVSNRLKPFIYSHCTIH